jgi:hypothetical protein
MDKQLKVELDKALQDVGNAAVPMTDEQVRDLTRRLKELQHVLVEWGRKNNPRR